MQRIAGAFADFKLIKGRKVAQIVVEIPIEQADAIVAALGGLPNPAVERWVAMAPVTTEAARAPSSEGSRPASASPASERKPMSASSLCAMRCREVSFQRFCIKTMGADAAWDLVEPAGNDFDDTVSFVRAYCGIASRGELSSSREALQRWQTLEATYLHWSRGEAA